VLALVDLISCSFCDNTAQCDNFKAGERLCVNGGEMGSVVKKRRKRMAKKKHKKLLKKTRIQRRNKK
jgi:hypothetical protein